MTLKSVLDWLRPPEPPGGSSPETCAKYRRSVNRWRWNVCLSLLGIFIFLVWAFAGGFARAGDVDQRVQKAIEPLKLEITTIKDAQAKQGAQLDAQNRILQKLSDQLAEQLIASTASQIRLLIGERCREPAGSLKRERLNRELEKLQRTYRDQTGADLRIRCDEL